MVNLEVVVRFPAETNDIFLLQNVVPTLGSTLTPFASIPGAFFAICNSDTGVKFTISLHLIPDLRITGNKPPLSLYVSVE